MERRDEPPVCGKEAKCLIFSQRWEVIRKDMVVVEVVAVVDDEQRRRGTMRMRRACACTS